MKKSLLIIMMLSIAISAAGFSAKINNGRVVYKKVCVQKSKKNGKCLKYENRKVNNKNNQNKHKPNHRNNQKRNW